MIDNRPFLKMQELDIRISTVEKLLESHEAILAQLQLNAEYSQALETIKTEEVTTNGI